MKTSILAGAPAQSAPRSRGFSAPVTQSADTGRGGGAAAAALEFGAGEQFSQFRVISGREQDQPAQHAGDRGAPGRQGLALARPAGDLQIGLVDDA